MQIKQTDSEAESETETELERGFSRPALNC